jgi:hypothetical protein
MHLLVLPKAVDFGESFLQLLLLEAAVVPLNGLFLDFDTLEQKGDVCFVDYHRIWRVDIFCLNGD